MYIGLRTVYSEDGVQWKQFTVYTAHNKYSTECIQHTMKIVCSVYNIHLRQHTVYTEYKENRIKCIQHTMQTVNSV